MAPTMEETILVGDDLMLGPPSPIIPPEIASHVLEGVDLCDGILRNLFLYLQINDIEPFCQDEIVLYRQCAEKRDKELRQRLQDSEHKLGLCMPLEQAKERAAQLQSEVALLERMKVVAAYLLAVLGGNTFPTADDLKDILGSVGAEADDDRIELLLSEVKGKDITELIASGREKFASVPSGGAAIAVAAPAAGGAAAAPADEPKKEEKVEEKEESDEIDPRHRYGHNLHYYYEEWCKSEDGQPFFYWLDIGNGRDVDLKECPRSMLRKQCITYLGPKKKGMFHHSSFLAGGATVAAGRFTAENGILKSIWAYSGHYRPSDENLSKFLSLLRENGVDLDQVQIRSSSNEDYEDAKETLQIEGVIEAFKSSVVPRLVMPTARERSKDVEQTAGTQADENVQVETKGSYKRTLSGGLQSPKADVPRKAILERMKSKSKTSSYQLGHQLSRKWSTGAGPRIGCVADYPVEVRVQALEFVNLSPRIPTRTRSEGFAIYSSPTSTLSPTWAASADAKS
ncbi:hypothetical protein COCNU_02G009570 [Cocos nucifera]|uniref:DUF7803 domain-containing protein n=1 Tax=Cocos nucifera TaxID=13894 RepID=A0A8K0HZZ9_COCNU|nr:hypothetical protein COCNU_02G009570 [Cocos nucifera]